MKHLNKLIQSQNITYLQKDIKNTFDLIIKTFRNKNKVFVAGDGCSSYDAEHFSAQLLKGFEYKRQLNKYDKEKIINIDKQFGENIADSLQYGLPVISLNSNKAILTAFANDVNYNNVFSQQLFALGNEQDTVIGFSTSGNSMIIRNLFVVAKAKNINTVLFTGSTIYPNNPYCYKFADIIINAPSHITYQIQEYHIKIRNALCLDIQEYFYAK